MHLGLQTQSWPGQGLDLLERQSPWLALSQPFPSHIPLGLQREKVGEVQ